MGNQMKQLKYTPCYKQAVTYRLVKAEKLIKTHHSEYGFNTACFITDGGMKRAVLLNVSSYKLA